MVVRKEDERIGKEGGECARAHRSRSQGRVSIARRNAPPGDIGVKRALGFLAPVDSRPVVPNVRPSPRPARLQPNVRTFLLCCRNRSNFSGFLLAAHVQWPTCRAPEFTLPCKLGLTSWTRARVLPNIDTVAPDTTLLAFPFTLLATQLSHPLDLSLSSCSFATRPITVLF